MYSDGISEMISQMDSERSDIVITYETIEDIQDDWESGIKAKQGSIRSGIPAFKAKPEFQNESLKSGTNYGHSHDSKGDSDFVFANESWEFSYDEDK